MKEPGIHKHHEGCSEMIKPLLHTSIRSIQVAQQKKENAIMASFVLVNTLKVIPSERTHGLVIPGLLRSVVLHPYSTANSKASELANTANQGRFVPKSQTTGATTASPQDMPPAGHFRDWHRNNVHTLEMYKANLKSLDPQQAVTYLDDMRGFYSKLDVKFGSPTALAVRHTLTTIDELRPKFVKETRLSRKIWRNAFGRIAWIPTLITQVCCSSLLIL